MWGPCLLLLGLSLQMSLSLVPGNEAPSGVTRFLHSWVFSLTLPLLFSSPVEEENPAFWNRKAAEALEAAKKLQPIQTSANNLIILMGDGECVRPGNPGSLTPQAPEAPGGTRGLVLTTFCSFRDGGVHSNGFPDTKGTAARPSGT